MKNKFLYFLFTSLLTIALQQAHAQNAPLSYGPSKESVLCDSTNNNALTKISFGQSQDRNTALPQKTLKILTWNAHKYGDTQFMNDLLNLSQNSDIVFVQEAMHTQSLQNKLSTFPGLLWNFHKSFCTFNDGATGVMTGSKLPVISSQTLVSPGVEPLLLTHKVSAITFVTWNLKNIMLINTHALNFNFGGPFKSQIHAIIRVIARWNGPIIWAGDFNTWNSDRFLYLKKEAQSQGLQWLAPVHENRQLRLDHIFVRNFSAVHKPEIHSEFNSSDHWPLVTELSLLN